MTNKNNIIEKQIRPNPLVEELVRYAEDDSLVLLQGFPVRTERHNKIRAYQDLTLSSYLEFNQAEVVRVIEGHKDDEPSIFIVSSTAKVIAVNRQSFTAESLKASAQTLTAQLHETGNAVLFSDGAGSEGSGKPTFKACRITGPIFKMVPQWAVGPAGPVLLIKQVFVGVGVDCS